MVFKPKVQLPAGVTTINEQFFDALIRHQIGLLNLSGSIKKDVNKLLDATEVDMADKIRSRLIGHKGLTTARDVLRLQTLLKSIKKTRLAAWSKVTGVWVSEMQALAQAEPAFTATALQTVVPTIINVALPSTGLLTGIVNSRPFQGKVLKEWAKDIARADLARIESQIKIGMVQGESSQVIARRIVGSRLQRGRDGATAITRRQAAGITRTAVIAISNQARREFYNENDKIFAKEQYTATLDSRTTPICQSLDGRLFELDKGYFPPVHFNCRSIRVGVIDGTVIGQRPMRASTEPMLVREFAKLKKIGGGVIRRDSLPRGQKGAFDDFKRKRVRELTGRVPAKVTYQEWLGRQSREFQNDVLGQTKGILFRKGGLKLDKFVSKTGSTLPLSALAKTQADAFRAAGLDPTDFL